MVTVLPITTSNGTVTVLPTSTFPPPGTCTTVTAIPEEDCFTIVVCGVNVTSVVEVFHHMMRQFHHSHHVICSDVDPDALSNMDTNIYPGGNDPQSSSFDSSFTSDDTSISAASHAFEDGSNSSDSDPNKHSKEGLGISKAKFDQLSEQEKREMGQRIRSQDNIHSDDEYDKKSKKYKSGKGKLQKMGNAGNRSQKSGSILCAIVIALVCLIINA